MTFLSRIMGFLRDMVFAVLFGAGAGMDAFFVAFKIPNFMRRLFAEGAFSQAFVPVMSEYQSQRTPAEVKQFVDQVAGTLGGILLLVTIVGVLAAPGLVFVFANGFTDEPAKFWLTSDLLRLTFPYLLFISLTAFAGGILNAYRQFAVPAFTPVLLNLVLILCAVSLAPLFEQPVMALAVGVFLAGLAQLGFQLPFLAKLGLLPRPRWAWSAAPVRRVLRLMLPAILGSSAAQIGLLFNTWVASFLISGSVSWLYYADRLMEFPLGVFAIALGTVILPSLSRKHAAKSPAEFSATLDWGVRMSLLIIVPAAVALMILSGPLLTTLFQYGEFKPVDVLMTRWSLLAYGVGLIGFGMVKIFAPGYFARQDTRTPMRIGLIALTVNMVGNIVFVWPMLHFEFVAPHMGLAMATATSALVNAVLLWRGLRRSGVYQPAPGWAALGLRITLATAVMALPLLWVSWDLSQWFAWAAWQRAGMLSAAVLAGLLSYFAVLWLSGFRPRHLKMAT